VTKAPHTTDTEKDKKDVQKKEFELRLATTLAPMLLTVAIFALASLSVVRNPKLTMVDEFLALVAGIAIFASALLVDHALDTRGVDTIERITFLGFGYMFFCFVVGVMTTAVFIIYSAVQAQGQDLPFGWQKSFVPFVLAGISVGGKMMWRTDRGVFFYAMLGFYGASIYMLL
jgi:hypothetical protein